MTERIYITLPEAAEYLQAKGLAGQTVGVLRQAIARGALAAAKDGRSWKTTREELDKYETRLWRQGTGGSPPRSPWRAASRRSKAAADTSSTSGMNFRQYMVLQRAAKSTLR